jgi:hypothetical protein
LKNYLLTNKLKLQSMKRIYTFLKIQVAMTLITFTLKAQPQINEGFTPSWSAPSSGWVIVNNSSPIGSTTWAQGNSIIFSALSGPATAYLGINYLTASQSTPAIISNFLITPTVSLSNGQIIQFATRTGVNTLYADRLQLLMSTQGTSTFVGTTSASVGDFTNLLLDVNPLLSLASTSVVSSGTVNGYPNAWAVYTTTLTGITGTITGRFAFRYFVTNAGLNGTNGNYIGIDDVYYSAPCIKPSLSVLNSSSVVCVNSSVTFSASGASTYTWNSPSGTTTNNPLSYTVGNAPGTITFTISGQNVLGCKSESLSITQQISNCAGLSTLAGGEAPTAYPNPFTNELNLKNIEGAIEIYNSIGQRVIMEIMDGSASIKTDNLPKGIYTLKHLDSSNKTTHVLKLLKQ